jgi:hypothetical protein
MHCLTVILCVRQALVAPNPPQGVLVRGQAGRLINELSQDVEFLVKRPTSLVHVDLVHIRDEEPDEVCSFANLLQYIFSDQQPG